MTRAYRGAATGTEPNATLYLMVIGWGLLVAILLGPLLGPITNKALERMFGTRDDTTDSDAPIASEEEISRLVPILKRLQGITCRVRCACYRFLHQLHFRYVRHAG